MSPDRELVKYHFSVISRRPDPTHKSQDASHDPNKNQGAFRSLRLFKDSPGFQCDVVCPSSGFLPPLLELVLFIILLGAYSNCSKVPR